MAKGEFGARLKREREMREVSIDELTKATRISARFIEALENEDWEKLPGGVFGHGFVRSIARYLGLDEEALLAEYDLARAETAQPIAPKPEERIPSPPKWISALAIVVILLFVVAVFYAGRYGWQRFVAFRAAHRSHSSSAAGGQEAGTSTASPTTTDPGAKGSSDSPILLDLSVSTSAPTRVRILADGQQVLDADLPAGETRHFSANQQFEVTAGDSSAVLLELNGQAMPPVGAPGASGTIVLSQKDLR
jgi:cytoskeleton protein RodZ